MKINNSFNKINKTGIFDYKSKADFSFRLFEKNIYMLFCLVNLMCLKKNKNKNKKNKKGHK